MAVDMNTWQGIGRLTRDPVVKQVGADLSVCELGLAVGDRKKGEDVVSFFDVVAFGKTAEVLEQYAGKGKQIAVRGRLEQQRWEKDGQKRSKVVIVADRVQLLGGKGDTVAGSAAAAITVDDGFEPVPAAASEDIPF
jgi:single-strand DNA-binding protein